MSVCACVCTAPIQRQGHEEAERVIQALQACLGRRGGAYRSSMLSYCTAPVSQLAQLRLAGCCQLPMSGDVGEGGRRGCFCLPACRCRGLCLWCDGWHACVSAGRCRHHQHHSEGQEGKQQAGAQGVGGGVPGQSNCWWCFVLLGSSQCGLALSNFAALGPLIDIAGSLT